MDHAAHEHHFAAEVQHGNHARHDQPAGHEEHAGHDKHGGHDPEMFKRLLWFSLIFTVPILYFSEMFQDWFDYSAPAFRGDQLIAPVPGTILFVYGGSIFLKGGWQEIQDRAPGMMLLISLAISVAWLASMATTFGCSISISGESSRCSST